MTVSRALLWIVFISISLAVPDVACAFDRSDGPPRPFWGAAVDGYPINDLKLASVTAEMGFSPELVVFFLQWPAPGVKGTFPESSLIAIRKKKAVPCITWEPFYLKDGEEVAVSHLELLAGEWDEYILGFAEACARWGQPLILRFAHEMNIQRYHWGTEKTAYGPQSPAIYREMFRYMVRLFRRAEASNVLWAFCPNAENVPDQSWDSSAGWNRAETYYPGDAFVDILGIDGYNWGTTQTLEKSGWQSSWRSFTDIFGPMFGILRELSPGKPIVIFETATAHTGGSKSKWIEEMIQTAEKWRLTGVIWFQVNKEIDWRLNSGKGGMVRLPASRSPADGIVQLWSSAFLEQLRTDP